VRVVHEPVDGGGGQSLGHELVECNWNWLRFVIGNLAIELRACVPGVSA